MGDKSGWLVKVEPKQTLGRRLSFRKKMPDRYFFILEGASFTWYDDVGGAQSGNIHMKDVDYVEAEDSLGGRATFAIRMRDKTSTSFIATSSRPEVSDAQYCAAWVAVLRKARETLKDSFGSAANTKMMF
jgi:hypothetical protein